MSPAVMKNLNTHTSLCCCGDRIFVFITNTYTFYEINANGTEIQSGKFKENDDKTFSPIDAIEIWSTRKNDQNSRELHDNFERINVTYCFIQNSTLNLFS